MPPDSESSLAPGVKATTSVKSRPRGSDSISSRETDVATALRVTSTIGASAVTVRVSVTAPMRSVRSARGEPPRVTARLRRVAGSRPESVAVTVYVPGGTAGMR